MKLNTRIWLIIVPVIVLGATFISSIVYQLEKEALIRQETINLQLQLKKISFISNSYIAFSDSYFSTITRSASLRNVITEDDEKLSAYSIENNLSALLSELSTLEVDHFSLVVMENSGDISYFFEDSDDPFSEPDQQLVSYIKELYSNESLIHKEILIVENSIKILETKILNPLTMKQPVSGNLADSKSISIIFGMLELDQLIMQLDRDGYQVNIFLNDDNNDIQENQYGLLLTEEVFPGFWISISFDYKIIDAALIEVLIQLIGYGLIIIVIISALLLCLISKNVTNPILELRNKILDVDDKNLFSKPKTSNDEISLLNLAYYDLYSKLKYSYEESQNLLNTDSLTKLSNRNVFNKQLEELINRGSGHERLSLFYIDIDNFKYINDTYGHESGDLFLIEFSQMLRSVLRPTDLVVDRICEASRLAGDEFGVIIYDYNDNSIIKHIALRLVSIFKDGFKSSFGVLPVSASIGISTYPDDGTTPTELIINADSAMYQAKSNGKNQYSFYSKALSDKVKREFSIELALQDIDFSEFELFYMPIINTISKKVTGLEALIRWSSVSLGRISPDEFIPIAEKKGHFKKIDLWVFNSVLENFQELKKVVSSDGKISINISAAQLATNDFIPSIISSLKRMDITADNFILEITETFSTQITSLVIDNLKLLKEKGFLLALDDFGSGYTSLIQLIDYPIDIIKIDKSMIDRIEVQGHLVVSSLTSVCQANGYSVTAEGVESIEQITLLEKIGVNSIQGFYFCKPLPINELLNKYK